MIFEKFHNRKISGQRLEIQTNNLITKFILLFVIISIFACQNNEKSNKYENSINGGSSTHNEKYYRKYFREYVNSLKSMYTPNEIEDIIKQYYYEPNEISKQAFEITHATEFNLSLKLRNLREVDSLRICFNEEIDRVIGIKTGIYDTSQCDCNAVIILNNVKIAEYCFGGGKIYSSLSIFERKTNETVWLRKLYNDEELDSLGIKGK